MDSTEEKDKENEKKSEENRKYIVKSLPELPLIRAAIESFEESRYILNSIVPNLTKSLLASTYMVSNFMDLSSRPMLLAFERTRKAADEIVKMRMEIETRSMDMIQMINEFNEKVKQASPAFPSAIELRKITNLDTYPESYSGISAATNAYIEALEKELKKERIEKRKLIKFIEELKKNSKRDYIV